MIALAVAAGVVLWLVMGSRPAAAKVLGPAGRGKAGRVFVDAMHEVQKQAAAVKIEEVFGLHPSNPFLAPFADLAKPAEPKADAGPKA